jgi:hypothetical protein
MIWSTWPACADAAVGIPTPFSQLQEESQERTEDDRRHAEQDADAGVQALANNDVVTTEADRTRHDHHPPKRVPGT